MLAAKGKIRIKDTENTFQRHAHHLGSLVVSGISSIPLRKEVLSRLDAEEGNAAHPNGNPRLWSAAKLDTSIFEQDVSNIDAS